MTRRWWRWWRSDPITNAARAMNAAHHAEPLPPVNPALDAPGALAWHADEQARRSGPRLGGTSYHHPTFLRPAAPGLFVQTDPDIGWHTFPSEEPPMPRQPQPTRRVTPGELAAAFTEWMRRYRDEPARFATEWSDPGYGGDATDYGTRAATYLLRVLDDRSFQA